MTFLLETLRLGLKNLRLHALRTALTSLGIILGVAAVILMVSIGEGNKQALLRDIQALGATNIIVRSSRPPEASNFGSQERSFLVRYGITRQDLRRARASLPDAAFIVPLKAVGSEVSYRSQRVTSQTFGTSPELMQVANLRLEPRGRYITDEDVQAHAPVAVIGSDVAAQFFRLEDPIGQTLRIDQQLFRIVGVLKPIGLAGGAGSALVGRDWNKDVHIPITNAEQLFGDMIVRRTSGSFTNEQVELSELYIAAGSTDAVISMSDRVRRIIASGHDVPDVQVKVPWELLENLKKTQLMLNIVLVAIAAISLLVGGIGIMNIMLASVTERTREIGIRRALGATRKHIVAQFLVETGTLSSVGGLIGIAVGVGASVGAASFLPWVLNLGIVRRFFDTNFKLETQVTLWSIIVSFVVAAVVGIAFGIYPAVVASRKDPVVALRHD